MSFFKNPQDLAFDLAQAVQTKRLSYNWSQKTLAERSSVSFGVIKKFERTGQISLSSLLKLAFALGAIDDFKTLFQLQSYEGQSLKQVIKPAKQRKRGRL